jgi:hypothetical protein
MEIAVTDKDFVLRGLYNTLVAVLADHPDQKAYAGLPSGGNLLNEVSVVAMLFDGFCSRVWGGCMVGAVTVHVYGSGQSFCFLPTDCKWCSWRSRLPPRDCAADSVVPCACLFPSQVFVDGLFAVPSATTPRDSPPPKCKNVETRKQAFALLAELSKGCEANYHALCALVMPHHQVR